MAANHRHDGDESIQGINVTPLVDITLVLLIIFMVTAKMIVSQAIPLDLPKAATAGATQTVLAVTIEANGRVLADGREVDDRTLENIAGEALARDKELRTVIQASSAVSHGTVIRVVDTLRKAGVTKVAFGAEKTASLGVP
jgi:biopolymer transport protein ExbD